MLETRQWAPTNEYEGPYDERMKGSRRWWWSIVKSMIVCKKKLKNKNFDLGQILSSGGSAIFCGRQLKKFGGRKRFF